MTNSAAKTRPQLLSKSTLPNSSAAFFWLAIIGGYTYYTVSSGLSPLESFKQVLDFMADSPFGPLVFVALYTLRPLILFSAVIFGRFGAGFLFGPLWGVCTDDYRREPWSQPRLFNWPLFWSGTCSRLPVTRLPVSSSATPNAYATTHSKTVLTIALYLLTL